MVCMESRPNSKGKVAILANIQKTFSSFVLLNWRRSGLDIPRKLRFRVVQHMRKKSLVVFNKFLLKV